MSHTPNPSEFVRPEHPGDLTPYLRHLLGGGTLPESQARAAFAEQCSAALLARGCPPAGLPTQ